MKSERIVKRFYIFPRKLKGGWAWGRSRVKQELQTIPLEFVSIMDWVDVEKLTQGKD